MSVAARAVTITPADVNPMDVDHLIVDLSGARVRPAGLESRHEREIRALASERHRRLDELTEDAVASAALLERQERLLDVHVQSCAACRRWRQLAVGFRCCRRFRELSRRVDARYREYSRALTALRVG